MSASMAIGSAIGRPPSEQGQDPRSASRMSYTSLPTMSRRVSGSSDPMFDAPGTRQSVPPDTPNRPPSRTESSTSPVMEHVGAVGPPPGDGMQIDPVFGAQAQLMGPYPPM